MNAAASTPRSMTTVFGSRRESGWFASGAAHLGALVTLAIVASRVHTPVERDAPSVVEFETPPPRRETPPPTPPPPPPPPPVDETPPPDPRPRPVSPMRAAHVARVAAPPPIMTAQSHDGPSSDTAASGDNTNFHGGDVGTPNEAPPAPPAPPAPAPPPPVVEAPRGPVQLPENATAPEPVDGNAAPEYPASARASGVQATVVARIVVNADGSVGRVEILRGHPDFNAAVESALRHWRYRPASIDGHAIAVFQVVRIPFRLENL